MRILLYCPLNPNPPKLWRQTMQSILKLQWDDPIDYLLSANDNPYTEPYLNITYQYNKARSMALDGGYDALLCVESDMVIPPDALQRLASLDAGVAYGLYVFRHTRHNWSAYTAIHERSGISISDDPHGARALWGSVIDVQGVGLGCTLISRNTLARLKFRLIDGAESKTSCDWAFALDCINAGISQRCDLGVVCGHLSYRPYPMILWPDVDAPLMYRRESLPGVEIKPIQPGDQFHVGMGETILIKAGDDGPEGNPVESSSVEQAPSADRKGDTASRRARTKANR